MQYLKADTQVKVVVGPVVAVGDGFTPVTTLAVSTADEAEILKHDAAAVTDISGNTFAAITGADGYYNLTITAAQLDTEGMLTVLINDDSLCLPVRHDFMVVNANVFDSLFAAATTDYLQVDAQQFGGSAGTFSGGRPEVNTTHAAGTAWGSGAITAASIATDAITSAKIAADAIGASELAADAASEIGTAVWATTTRVLTANTNLNDPTAAAIADAVWDEATAGHVAAGSFGLATSDILTDTAEIGVAGAGLTNINLPDQTMNITGNLSGSVGSVTGAVGSVTGAVGSVTGNVGGNVVGSVGSISGVTFPANFADLSISVTTGLVDITQAAADKAWSTAARVLTANTNLNDPTAASIADAVWDEAIAGHLGAGSTGEALNAAGAAGDPWTTALPGAYGAGSAGYILGSNLNAPVGTVDTVVDAIKAVTDNLPDSGALSSLATAAALATVDTVVDAILVDTAEIGVAGAGLTEAGGTGDQLTALSTAAALATAQADLDILTGSDGVTLATTQPNYAPNTTTPPTAAAIAAAVLAAGDVDGYTLEEAAKLILAAAAGKLSGAATTTVTIRAADDSKARITATVDADGNRSAVTLDEAG